MVKISVVSPIYNEATYIEQFIESLTSQEIEEEVEFILVDGDSDDGTTEVVKKFSQIDSRVKLISNPQKITPISMNLGIKNSSGDIIVRMDVHASYPPDYIKRLVDTLRSTDADNVGAVIETIPGDRTELSKSIAFAMSHPLGVGPSNFRTGNFTASLVDTVPFGCYRREVFDRIGFYDEDLVRSQDDELNARLISSGGKILLVPDLKIQYFGRKTYSQLWRMFYQYGYSKPLVNKKLRKPATLRQFAPPIFVLGALVSILSMMMDVEVLGYLFWFCYFAPLLIVCWKKYKKISMSLVYSLLAFVSIHFAYGIGYWLGIWNFWFKKEKSIARETKISRG